MTAAATTVAAAAAATATTTTTTTTKSSNSIPHPVPHLQLKQSIQVQHKVQDEQQ